MRSWSNILADMIASLSLATDPWTAFASEKALRNSVLAVRLGEAVGPSRTWEGNESVPGSQRWQ
jgi:hypothetical protein